ncbi:MAG: 30S ribosomal protein S6 [Ardenticatenia bacterium]|nr:30S ribosomal protein S6 [Ardenticatenia bacterium]
MEDLRRYELYVVLRPDLEDEELTATVERLNGFITARDGLILSLQHLGRRRLAYPIKHHLEGYDLLYDLLLPPLGPAFVEQQMRLREEILRYLLVRRDDLPPLSPEELARHRAAVPAEGDAGKIVAESDQAVESESPPSEGTDSAAPAGEPTAATTSEEE